MNKILNHRLSLHILTTQYKKDTEGLDVLHYDSIKQQPEKCRQHIKPCRIRRDILNIKVTINNK